MPAVGDDVTALMNGGRQSSGVPAVGEDVTALMGGGDEAAAPEQPQREGFIANFLKNVLPSTTPSDYIEGPIYAAKNPIDSMGLLLDAIIGAHGQQASKTAEAGGRVLSEPSLAGKAGAASEMLGHGLATVLPLVGPAAANAGEQIGSGDIAGGMGAAAGILTPSALGAARGVVPAAKQAAATRLEQSAVRGMERAIHPTRIDTKAKTAKVVPEMLERRIWEPSLEKLEARAANNRQIAGENVGDAISPHGHKYRDTMTLVDELEKSKAEYQDVNKSGETVTIDPQRVQSIQDLQDTLMSYGDNISVDSLVKVRRVWDDVVDAARGFIQPDLGTKVKAWAAREGRSAIADELVQAVPDIQKVNAEYSFWKNVEDITSASVDRRTGQNRGLMPTIAGGAGAVVGEAMSGGAGLPAKALSAAVGAKTFASLKRLFDSPGYQMWSAVQKQRLADALMANDAGRIRGLLHQGLVSASVGSRGAARVQSGQSVPKVAENSGVGFDEWYSRMAAEHGLSPNPDGQFYDYRAAFKAGAKPDASGHWPSQFKQSGHPNEIVGGFNTRTGEPEPGHELVLDVQQLIELGWDPASAKQMVAKARKAKGQTATERSSARGTRQ